MKSAWKAFGKLDTRSVLVSMPVRPVPASGVKETRVVGMFCEKLLAWSYGTATVFTVGSPWTKNGSQLIRPLISLFRTDGTNSAKQDDISHSPTWRNHPVDPSPLLKEDCAKYSMVMFNFPAVSMQDCKDDKDHHFRKKNTR